MSGPKITHQWAAQEKHPWNPVQGTMPTSICRKRHMQCSIWKPHPGRALSRKLEGSLACYRCSSVGVRGLILLGNDEDETQRTLPVSCITIYFLSWDSLTKLLRLASYLQASCLSLPRTGMTARCPYTCYNILYEKLLYLTKYGV